MIEFNPELPNDDVMKHVDSWKEVVERRATQAGLPVHPGATAHLVADGWIFVICNPMINNRKNIHVITLWDKKKNEWYTEMLPILAPWLCVRLNLDGSLDADGGYPKESIEFGRTENLIIEFPVEPDYEFMGLESLISGFYE